LFSSPFLECWNCTYGAVCGVQAMAAAVCGLHISIFFLRYRRVGRRAEGGRDPATCRRLKWEGTRRRLASGREAAAGGRTGVDHLEPDLFFSFIFRSDLVCSTI
jgi:hypothetical protein